MKRTARIHDAIGEARIGIFEAGKLVEVHVERVSTAGQPKAGDIFTGRVTRIERSLGAAFVDLGTGRDGFLRFTNSPGAPRLTEGQLIDARVGRAREPGKGAILTYRGPPTHDAPGPVEQFSLRERLDYRFEALSWEEGEVPALSELVQREIAIPGGGSVAIEPTRALVAVDVDKGRQVSGLKAGEAAAPIIARELRLRGLGGLVCIDLPNLRQPKQRGYLMKAVEAAFADDPDKPKFAPLSRFGVVEMTRIKAGPSLDEMLAATPVETAALEAIARAEREGRASPGARLTLTVPGDLHAWLASHEDLWKPQLAERLGDRTVVREGDELSVEADR